MPTIDFVPDTDWQTVQLPVAWLATSGGSHAVSKKWIFEIMVQGATGDFRLDLDELRAY